MQDVYHQQYQWPWFPKGTAVRPTYSRESHRVMGHGSVGLGAKGLGFRVQGSGFRV